MKNSILDVIVVGGGYAGLSSSYYLKKQGLNHVVFERGKIGESWRSQRWDSFTLNSANKLVALPGKPYEGNNPDAFCLMPEFISSLEEYVSIFGLPVTENSKVISIEKPGEFFNVTVSTNDHIQNYSCRQVIIASGVANEIKIPSFAKNVPGNIRQLHTSEYRNAKQLPGGSVLVVGSAQSGCQIAEDLADAGRKVYLSTSMVGRTPRWYRGKDIMDWLIDIKFFDARAEEIKDPTMLHMRAPQLTGTGDGRTTISLQSLAKKGIMILGKMENIDGQNVLFQPNAPMFVKFADEFSNKVKEMIEGFILKNQLPAPPPEKDEADIPDINAVCASSITSLNLYDNNIRSIIWSTGFNADFSYIKLPVFDSEGNPKHQDGVSIIPGLYFLGLPWLRIRKSVLLYGIKDDAEFIVGKACNYFIAKPGTIAV
jgi:putative flavoprotein involved in K+ transport